LKTATVRDVRTRGLVTVATAERKAALSPQGGHTRLPPQQPPVAAAEAPKRPDGPPYAPLYVIRFETEVGSKQVDAIRKQWNDSFAPGSAPTVIVLGGGARLELVNAPIVGIRD
jgi:hypothetical protein